MYIYVQRVCIVCTACVQRVFNVCSWVSLHASEAPLNFVRTLRVRAAAYQFTSPSNFLLNTKKILLLGTGQASDFILSVFTSQSPLFFYLNRSPFLFCDPYF
jgi:hypothetical protein